MPPFDGMAGLLTEIFGAPVLFRPALEEPRTVASVFRETPIEVTDSDGRAVLIVAPTWRVRRDLVPEVARGDRIEPGNGKVYEIVNAQPGGSPAGDAFWLCELEEERA
ncbi:head-tail joining protein [Halodurantibacterium flavum]|uniref:Head-tail adaptor protein n=1 Tax=Halodurantibacterium flavum TaxID=1382802 RepID=A0ABW4S9L3_9RHOB